MAWNFRRRKKIAPGVYINMSKKGISTTVGPKGASMTFGPNGTYMNTSIPGTGLYNRQKIGSHGKQGATSQNSHSMYYNSSKKNKYWMFVYRNHYIYCVYHWLFLLANE